MDLVERVCSRVAVIVDGEVLAEGTIDEVRAGQTLTARFVELSGAGVRIPQCFPTGFTLGSVLRITLQEMKKLPLREPRQEPL